MFTFVTPREKSRLLPFAVLAMSMAATAVGGFARVYDQVALMRLEFPPYLISYAALCQDERDSALKVVKAICENERPKVAGATYGTTLK